MFPFLSSERGIVRVAARLSLSVSTATSISASLFAAGSGLAQSAPEAAQPQKPLAPVIVTQPRPRSANAPRATRSEGRRTRAARQRQQQTPVAPAVQAGPANVAPPTPLNTNAVAESASRLDLPVRQIPATVEVIDQQTMREQGYRTTTETAQGAVGVLSGDAAGAPAAFSIRGFTYGDVNILYNGISIGPQSITSRVMDTANLSQVEFLKGPSSLMSGLDAIGGSVNYVTKQPTSGPIKNETDVSWDSLGTVRSHFGSGGSTSLQGLDYRFDMIESRLNSFIDGDHLDITNLSTRLDYRATDAFKTFVAVEYKKDSGHSYWGTPLVPVAFAGPYAKGGVVSGYAVNTFDGSILGPLTVDSRTLHTNYNVTDNSTGAEEFWLRGGFEWAPTNDIKVKNQTYYYHADRHWIDSETYAFNLSTSTIDRDRFAVLHHQHVAGNNTDLTWDSRLLGFDNRFAAQLQVSQNSITFKQHDDGGYPQDTVSVVDPVPGFYGPIDFDTRNSRLTTVAGSFEDRLKLTPYFALIGGVRIEDLTLARDGINADGSIPAGQPFTKTWTPISYRAAYTWEPIRDMTFYSMYATAFDPAAAGIFSISPGNSLQLTSARIYETGVKQLFWDNKAEWSFAAYDIARRNVYVQTSDTTFSLAGEIATKGIELAAAVRPIEGWKFWGNVALIQARYANFDFEGGSWTGNTPSNVAPLVVNAGASYRFNDWRWPVEIGGSVRHVGNRYLNEDDATTMNAYTVGDAFASIDFDKPSALPYVDKVKLTFRVRNITNAVYAAWSDPGYPDQVYLGAPRTYEVATSFRW